MKLFMVEFIWKPEAPVGVFNNVDTGKVDVHLYADTEVGYIIEEWKNELDVYKGSMESEIDWYSDLESLYDYRVTYVGKV